MKYKKYANYKNSGVEWLGEIPNKWSTIRSKYIYKEINERSITGAENLLSVSEYYGVKPRTTVMSDGEHISRAESLIDYKKCSKNDLVMNIMLAWKRGLGISRYEGIVSPAYCVFRSNNLVWSLFMHYLYRTDLYTTNFKSKSSGVIDSRLRLYPEMFGTVETILPSFKEQQQIANFLDNATSKIDTLIEKQTKLIELLKEKRQALISHAVTKGINPHVKVKDTDITWLNKIPNHWTEKQFRYATKIYRGKFGHRPRNDPSLYDGIYPFIQTGDVARANKYITKYKQTLNNKGIKVSEKFPKGTLVMAIAANIGDVAILNFEAYAPDSIVGFLPNRDIDLMYLRYSFIGTINILKSTAIQSTQANLNIDRIANVNFIFPPLEEQEEIVGYLDNKTSKIDKLIEKANKSIELLKEKRTALISAAVTGKIDVREIA